MQHTNLKERLEAAKLLMTHDPPAPVLVDSMKNEALLDYGALPERLYIVQDGRVVYEGGLGPMDYKLEEVQLWLEEWRARDD